MRFVATYTVQPDPSRIESYGRAYQERVEFDADDHAAALLHCAINRLMYFGPIAPEEPKA